MSKSQEEAYKYTANKVLKNRELTFKIKKWLRNEKVTFLVKKNELESGRNNNYSRTQIWANMFCNMNNNTVKHSARFRPEQKNIGFYCVENFDLDHSIYAEECLSNCGKLVFCKGGVKSLTRKRQFSFHLVREQIKLNCKESQLQESLQESCKFDQIPRVDGHSNVKCYSVKTMNYGLNGKCLDDCRNIVDCLGAPDPSDKGELVNIESIDWDALTNGCPCSEDYDAHTFAYQGCQNFSKSDKKCLNWSEGMTSGYYLYEKRFAFPENYCRQIDKTQEIYCLTASNKTSRCLPKEIPEIKVQSGIMFDIWITPYIPRYKLKIIFIDHSSTCGDQFAAVHQNIVQSYELEVFNMIRGNGTMNQENDLFEYSDPPIYEPSYVFKGYTALDGISSESKICACMHSNYYDNANGIENPCINKKHYRITVGVLIVQGRSDFVPNPVEEMTDEVVLDRNLGLNGIVSLVNEADAVVCRNNEQLNFETCSRSIDALLDIEMANRTQKSYMPEMDRRPQSKYTHQMIARKDIQPNHNVYFHIEKAGSYSFVDQNIKDTNNPLIKYRVSLQGFYSNKTFTLIYDKDKGDNYREQSLFFESWKVNMPPVGVIISKYSSPQEVCEKPFAYSINIFPVVNSVIDKSLTLWRASDFEITKRLTIMQEKPERFQVCAFTEDSKLHKLGSGIFVDFINHEVSEIMAGPEITVPNDVFNYKIYDEWDLITFLIGIKEDENFEMLHSLHKNFTVKKDYTHFAKFVNSFKTMENLNPDTVLKKSKNHKNDYPAILSFWSYPDENVVRMFLFRPNRVSPTYIGSIEVNSPIAFGIYITMNKLVGIVLNEGEFGINMYEIELDRTAQEKNKFNLKLMKTSCDIGSEFCTKLVSPVDMKLISYFDDCVNRHLIIVTDIGLNCIILYNSTLTEVSKLCRQDGHKNIFEPSQISCTDSRFDVGQCINTFEEFGFESDEERGHVNCFITQPHGGSILWVQVDVFAQRLTLLDTYGNGDMSENKKDTEEDETRISQYTLIRPITVETVLYANTVLIYVIESENPALILLIIDLNSEAKKITYYSKTELKMISYGNFIHISKLLMSVQNDERLNDQDYIMLFRLGVRKKYNKEMETLTIVNVMDTISINNFEYTIPEWIVIGDEINLTPKIDSGNKQNLIRYELDILNLEDEVDSKNKNHKHLEYVNRNFDWTGNATHKNTIKINEKTGEINIKLKYIHGFHLSIRVTAFGFIESRSTVLSFNVVCKDGHYYSHNENDQTPNESNGCKICERGEYNSIQMIKDDFTNWSKCTKCPDRQTTISEGATSGTQCLCAPGYEPSADLLIPCSPCEPGKWKSSVGFQPCIGNGCYKNSYSNKTASVSEEDRDCSCHEGYYYVDHAGGIKECIPCETGYFCPGGIKGRKIKCPSNTTTVIDVLSNGLTNSLPKSLSQCVCKKGYEIVSLFKLVNRKNPEYKLKKRIEKEISMMNLQNQNINVNRMVCIPCGHKSYNDNEGNKRCTKCPDHTFSESMSPVSKKECNMCDEGYYESESKNSVCEKCEENHFCVGSSPMSDKDKLYAKKKIPCPENSKSVEPFEMNVSMLNCLCVEGYVPVITGSLLKCTQAPRDYYKDFVGNRDAIPCPNGSMTLSTGATSRDSCVCERGTYFDVITQHCTICPIGKYCMGGKDDQMNHRQPMDCADSNALTKTTGASSISECACKPGYYMDKDSNNICKECPENHYKSYVSNDLCTKCDENSSTSGKKGSTSKEQCVCDPGYYFDNGCVSCNFNDRYCPGGVIEIKDNKGAIKIVTQTPIKCPPNTEITPGVDNASSIKFCKCKKGYSFVSEDDVMNTKKCAPCSPGTYKSSVMDSSCNGLCTQNATSLNGAVSSNQCFCRSGYYYLEGGVCSKCMEGAINSNTPVGTDMINTGNNINNLIVDIDDHVKPIAVEGYYLDKINLKLRKSDDWKFIKCPIKGSCLGNDKCSSSMEHYLCSECKMGYTNNFVKGVLCQQCPNMFINISLTMIYGLGLLLINIVMACLNISAGFNRRSIHSVVIKIALNYAICTSVINVINFAELKIPMGLSRITNSFTKVFDSEDVVYYTSIDCLIRKFLKVNHADSLFYVTLYTVFLPIILLFVVTMLMWVILSIFKVRKYNDTRTKLALLQQAEIQGMHKISEKLREQYENERLLMIFRYIPLPNQTIWLKFRNFIEDMIPIYVTVLFSVHGKITSRMLSLLDCSYIDLGRSFPGKYMLRPAMSIKCSLYPSDGYIKYLILGLSGLVIWGFGIPFLSFTVLYTNRKNLYATSIRMKYGFLHNGFRQDYWYWETIVFTRKCLVLVIGSIVIVPSQNYSGSRIWMALVVAIIFLIVQLIYKPFDERDYFVLGRLENHSMIAWTFTLILFSIIIESNFNPLYNITIILFIIILNSAFILEVVFQLLVAYSHNLRIQVKKTDSLLYRFIYGNLIKLSSKIKSSEPIISFDTVTCSTNLKSPVTIIDKFNRFYAITYHDKQYFSHVMTEIVCFANVRMELDVIPCDFPEFITRLTFAVHVNETERQNTENLVKSFADGNIDKLVNLSFINKSYTNNFNYSGEDKDGFKESEVIVNPAMLFDKQVLSSGIPLSDFYMAFSIIKLNEFKIIANTYVHFKELKIKEKAKSIEYETKKLNDLSEIEKMLDDRSKLPKDVEEVFCSKEELDELNQKVRILEEKIHMFKNDPLRALKVYKSEDYSHLDIGDFGTDIVNFGFKKRTYD
ncbi:uncharacterized protein TOT_010001343 [Theileria orientalis strain Shintoku]|uniref:EGF-like domain-containing protein n=1 Tax=Theileria orientalis strain Shintoku TaxID=869250 RepID=J4C2Z1_THEOR|nr:uncharacterized protein TOT_010001343 [Theileria orientalis strain Shintoku]BAM39531.1 uncharacterized protein TOT_010001343 [Theileria orientalis strain Shintoku]|eukprot:XP_009689832.1 uncharacterized protein TOT_010001343 [Theileria orientalis strain Shintoku]